MSAWGANPVTPACRRGRNPSSFLSPTAPSRCSIPSPIGGPQPSSPRPRRALREQRRRTNPVPNVVADVSAVTGVIHAAAATGTTCPSDASFPHDPSAERSPAGEKKPSYLLQCSIIDIVMQGPTRSYLSRSTLATRSSSSSFRRRRRSLSMVFRERTY